MNNLFLTKFVLSIVINKPYDSIRLILPEIISPMWRVLKSLISDFRALLAPNVFKVTSTRFDKGSTDSTLYSSFLVHYCIYSDLYKSFWRSSKKTYLPIRSFPTGKSFSGLSTNPSDKFERRILASIFRESKMKHPFDVIFFT